MVFICPIASFVILMLFVSLEYNLSFGIPTHSWNWTEEASNLLSYPGSLKMVYFGFPFFPSYEVKN
jgi:hypothetical protein